MIQQVAHNREIYVTDMRSSHDQFNRVSSEQLVRHATLR